MISKNIIQNMNVWIFYYNVGNRGTWGRSAPVVNGPSSFKSGSGDLTTVR